MRKSGSQPAWPTGLVWRPPKAGLPEPSKRRLWDPHMSSKLLLRLTWSQWFPLTCRAGLAAAYLGPPRPLWGLCKHSSVFHNPHPASMFSQQLNGSVLINQTRSSTASSWQHRSLQDAFAYFRSCVPTMHVSTQHLKASSCYHHVVLIVRN